MKVGVVILYATLEKEFVGRAFPALSHHMRGLTLPSRLHAAVASGRAVTDGEEQLLLQL